VFFFLFIFFCFVCVVVVGGFLWLWFFLEVECDFVGVLGEVGSGGGVSCHPPEVVMA